MSTHEPAASRPDDPHWLDHDEQQAWLALCSMLLRLPHQLDLQLRRDANMTHFEYSVLAVLSGHPEQSMRMSHLATTVEGSLSRLSQVVTRLERRGWVRRLPDAEDRRTTLAKLTPKGLEVLEAAAPGHVEMVRSLVIEPLTHAQLRQLTEIGRRVMRAVDPHHRLPGHDEQD